MLINYLLWVLNYDYLNFLTFWSVLKVDVQNRVCRVL